MVIQRLWNTETSESASVLLQATRAADFMSVIAHTGADDSVSVLLWVSMSIWRDRDLSRFFAIFPKSRDFSRFPRQTQLLLNPATFHKEFWLLC